MCRVDAGDNVGHCCIEFHLLVGRCGNLYQNDLVPILRIFVEKQFIGQDLLSNTTNVVELVSCDDDTFTTVLLRDSGDPITNLLQLSSSIKRFGVNPNGEGVDVYKSSIL